MVCSRPEGYKRTNRLVARPAALRAALMNLRTEPGSRKKKRHRLCIYAGLCRGPLAHYLLTLHEQHYRARPGAVMDPVPSSSRLSRRSGSCLSVLANPADGLLISAGWHSHFVHARRNTNFHNAVSHPIPKRTGSNSGKAWQDVLHCRADEQFSARWGGQPSLIGRIYTAPPCSASREQHSTARRRVCAKSGKLNPCRHETVSFRTLPQQPGRRLAASPQRKPVAGCLCCGCLGGRSQR